MGSEKLFYVGDDDPFADRPVLTAPETTVFPPVLSDDVVRDYPGQWVLLRGRKVVAAAPELEELLQSSERQPDDATAFVRDPQELYL